MMKVLVVLMLVCSVQSMFYKQGDIEDIKLELKNLQQKNKEQAAKLDKQEDQLKEQAAKLDKQEDQLKEQAAKLDKQENQLKEQSVKQVAQQTDVGKLKKQLQGEQVAFAASLWTSGSNYFSAKIYTPMVFKRVVTNIGNAYSPVTGRFTAPLRGAYHFECHIHGFEVTSIAAQLMKNTEQIFFASQDNRQPFYDSASNSVTLLLKAGDVVYMRQWGGTKVYDDSYHRTTFSGHLLFSM